MKPPWKQILILSVIAGGLGTATSLWHPKAVPYAQARLEEGALELSQVLALTKPYLWIDSRDTATFEKEHIPNAILLNEDDWESNLSTLLEHWNGQVLIVYCASETCHTSKAIVDRLKHELGFDDVYFLKGGWETWNAAK
jgi:rhodanese-related sulfurtransferase